VIFQHPIAWIGLAALAVPLVVHLLGRRFARRLPFPTLRFITPSRASAIRPRRVTDVALLAVRLGILVAATAALAQPLLQTGDRLRALEATVARAVIVDASASMNRLAADGRTALEQARQIAEASAGDAASSRVIESPAPGDALHGAAAWLQTQKGRLEILVVSDFQPQALAAADLERVPAGIGMQFTRVEAGASPARTPDPSRIVRLVRLAGAGERDRAEAAYRAALATGAPEELRADRPIAIVFPQADDRAALVRDARPLSRAWMFEAADAIRRDPLVIEVARVTPAMFASHTDRLLVFSPADAGSLASAALMRAAARAVAAAPADRELDRTVRDDRELQSWERAASAVARPGSADRAQTSDGRWFWGAALILLALETWMRRSRAAPAEAGTTHARVA
jgi:hypothetical protein